MNKNKLLTKFKDSWIPLILRGLAGLCILLIGMTIIDTWVLKSEDSAKASSVLPTQPAIPTEVVDLPYYSPLEIPPADLGLQRSLVFHTDDLVIPVNEVGKYTVEKGDTIFGIAEKFGLRPETILWGNLNILGDNAQNLRPGQEINVLPMDGVLHEWREGEGLNGVTNYYGVTPEVVINWPGNNLSMETIGDFSDPNIEPGTFLFVPGGEREFISWSAPEITRENPAVASHIGPGFCGPVTGGAIGGSTFIYPTVMHHLSGYDYSPEINHLALDFAGSTGNAIYAVDAGVVVYAGWNNYGYGNMVVIDHGNGWQSLYAHLDTWNVVCGQSVYQGDVIAGLGNTGNSSGPHLHFDLRYNGTPVNPWNVLQ